MIAMDLMITREASVNVYLGKVRLFDFGTCMKTNVLPLTNRENKVCV